MIMFMMYTKMLPY